MAVLAAFLLLEVLPFSYDVQPGDLAHRITSKTLKKRAAKVEVS